MIGGFIILGNAPKPVVLRGLGPSLVNFGVPAATVLNDPVLELHGPNGALITMNDNWKDSPQRTQIEGSIYQPTDDRESVILATLPPANYTVILRGSGQTAGVGLVEIYDNNQGADPAFANISTRGFVQVGDNVMIGGFSLGGNPARARIAVRGVGPSLAQFGLSNVMADPTLELHNANGTTMLTNDNWTDDPVVAAQLSVNGLALQDPKESGILHCYRRDNSRRPGREKRGDRHRVSGDLQSEVGRSRGQGSGFSGEPPSSSSRFAIR